MDDDAAARAAFPRGLVQPEGGFRFGADALLLAAFAAPGARERVLDLGTGCGAAGLGLLLHAPEADLTVVGLDADPAMVAAAAANAARLGLADRYTALAADVRELRPGTPLAAESFQTAMANPPYRHPDSGRKPPGPAKAAARFEESGGLAEFAACAASLLAGKGRFALIYPAERLAYAFAVLSKRRLTPKRLLAVHPRIGEPAGQVLIEARKNGNPGLRLEPPLFLYEGTGAASRVSRQALAFCPFLAANPGPRQKTRGA